MFPESHTNKDELSAEQYEGGPGVWEHPMYLG